MDAEKGEAFKARFISQMQANPEQIAEEARCEVETRIQEIRRTNTRRNPQLT
jgi:hypothetical protein